MASKGTRRQAAGEWCLQDVCLYFHSLLGKPMFAARVEVYLDSTQPLDEAAAILESMLEDARLEVLNQWSKLRGGAK
jgi:hypothetical protein